MLDDDRCDRGFTTRFLGFMMAHRAVCPLAEEAIEDVEPGTRLGGEWHCLTCGFPATTLEQMHTHDATGCNTDPITQSEVDHFITHDLARL